MGRYSLLSTDKGSITSIWCTTNITTEDRVTIVNENWGYKLLEDKNVSKKWFDTEERKFKITRISTRKHLEITSSSLQEQE